MLCSLTHRCPENCERYVAAPAAVTLLVELCEAPSEARDPAAELFVTLIETDGVRPTLERRGGTRCLEAIAAANDISDAIAARAKLATRQQRWT